MPKNGDVYRPHNFTSKTVLERSAEKDVMEPNTKQAIERKRIERQGTSAEFQVDSSGYPVVCISRAQYR